MTDYYENDGKIIRRTGIKNVPDHLLGLVDEEDQVLCPICGRCYPYGSYHECPEVDE